MQENITRVKNLHTKEVGILRALLSVQFTVEYKNGSTEFIFYNDKNDTWEVVDELDNT